MCSAIPLQSVNCPTTDIVVIAHLAPNTAHRFCEASPEGKNVRTASCYPPAPQRSSASHLSVSAPSPVRPAFLARTEVSETQSRTKSIIFFPTRAIQDGHCVTNFCSKAYAAHRPTRHPLPVSRRTHSAGGHHCEDRSASRSRRSSIVQNLPG